MLFLSERENARCFDDHFAFMALVLILREYIRDSSGDFLRNNFRVVVVLMVLSDTMLVSHNSSAQFLLVKMEQLSMDARFKNAFPVFNKENRDGRMSTPVQVEVEPRSA